MTAKLTELIVGPVSAIPPGEGRTFSAFGEKVAVFRSRSGQVFAVQAECPHRGGPLADGLVGGTTVICPLHAWKFDLATGGSLMGNCGLKTFPVRVDEKGQIRLTFEADPM
jgi:nitrite reductase (NADH) small subunit